MKLAAAVGLALCGCGVLLPANGPPTTAPLVAEMVRFGCLGEWPTYQLDVYADGTVQYEGFAHVRVVGKRTTDIGRAGVELLRRHLDRSGLFTEDHDFAPDIDDLCGISWIEYRGVRAEFYGGSEHVPWALIDLAFEFEELSHSNRWTRWPEGEDHVSIP